MKPKDPTSPFAWLARVKGNLNLAEKGGRLKGVLLEDLCFNAQQEAEKHSKQYVRLRARIFPKLIH